MTANPSLESGDRTIPSINYLIENQPYRDSQRQEKASLFRIKDYQKKGVLPVQCGLIQNMMLLLTELNC